MQNYGVLEKNNAIYFINVVNWSITQVNDRKTLNVCFNNLWLSRKGRVIQHLKLKPKAARAALLSNESYARK